MSKSFSEFTQELEVMARQFSREVNRPFLALMARDLMVYDPADLLAALSKCRRELSRFPTVADIIQRLPLGWPTADEAWTALPRGEDESACWTDEAAQAYGQVRATLEEDHVAARMAFRDIYNRLVSEARDRGRRAHWSVTFGHSRQGRLAAVRDAVERGRINRQEAQRLLPDADLQTWQYLQISEQNPVRAMLTGPKAPAEEPSLEPLDVAARIAELRQRLENEREK